MRHGVVSPLTCYPSPVLPGAAPRKGPAELPAWPSIWWTGRPPSSIRMMRARSASDSESTRVSVGIVNPDNACKIRIRICIWAVVLGIMIQV